MYEALHQSWNIVITRFSSHEFKGQRFFFFLLIFVLGGWFFVLQNVTRKMLFSVRIAPVPPDYFSIQNFLRLSTYRHFDPETSFFLFLSFYFYFFRKKIFSFCFILLIVNFDFFILFFHSFIIFCWLLPTHFYTFIAVLLHLMEQIERKNLEEIFIL